MKKLFAVLLAVAMLLSLGVAAFADDDKSQIKVADSPAGTTYLAYKLFGATVDKNEFGEDVITYSIDSTSSLFTAMFTPDVDENNAPTGTYTAKSGVKFKLGDETETAGVYVIEADNGYSAADFAAWLLDSSNNALPATATYVSDENGVIKNGNDNLAAGYYLVVPGTHDNAADTPDDDKLGALTTVLDGRETQIQNKNDMPLDKEVETGDDDLYDDNEEAVKVGDTLKYKITAKTPGSYKDNDFEYIYHVKDKMSQGLTFNNEIKITIGSGADQIEITLTYDPGTKKLTQVVKKGAATYTVPTEDNVETTDVDESAAAIAGVRSLIGDVFRLVDSTNTRVLTGNEVRFNAPDTVNGGDNFDFELSLAVASTALRGYTSADVVIEYSATVNENAVGTLVKNTAVLEYGHDSDLTVKDAETDNYIARLVIDKFETGNRSQKLAGAKFALYKLVNGAKQYYKLTEAVAAVDAVLWTEEYMNDHADEVQAWADAHEGNRPTTTDVRIPAVAAAPPSVTWTDTIEYTVTTDEDGFAQFAMLDDGTYYLQEVEAPVDYARLLGDIEIEIDGKAATDQRLTAQQRNDALTTVANVANTPGSSMPSTGGVGATLLTIGGVVLMLAAGAYLVLRKRQEN